MKNMVTISAVALLLLFLPSSKAFAGFPKKASRVSITGPLGFIENRGQFLDENQKPRLDLLFMFERSGMKVQLMQNRISFELYTMQKDNSFNEATGLPYYSQLDPEDRPSPRLRYESSRIDVEFIGANPHPEIISEEMMSDYLNYYLAHTPVEGITRVKQYNKITYKNLYPNIDLVLIATPDQNPTGSLAYDFIVHPGGNVNDIRYRYHGSSTQKFCENGTIETVTARGKIVEMIPESYLKNKAGVKLSPVNVSFDVTKNVIGFHAGAYDKNQSLVIDPTLVWATFCGGDSSEEGRGLTTDSLGNVAIIGRSNSSNNIATAGAHQVTLAANVDIILEKYDSTGQRIWGTYYGGSGFDHGRGLVADKMNNLFLGCHTNSPDGCATPGSYKPVFSGGDGDDGLLAYFSADGFRIWATYYGGSHDETIRRLSVDHAGNVLMVGYTFSTTGIATPGVYQSTWGGNADLCLSKWSPDGNLIWGSYLGGPGEDHGRSVAVDKDDNIYINGSTGSHNGIATPNSYRNHIADKQDYLLGKFTSDGQIAWTSYWGGAVEDRGRGVFVDSSSKYVYFTGYSASDTGVATPGAFQEHWVSGYDNQGEPYHDIVLMKWTVDGQIVWSSYLGGAKDDRGRAITMIGDNEIYVSGSTESNDAIATPDGFQTVWGGKGDMFLEIWDSNGNRNYGTYFGGSGDEDNLALAIDDKHQHIYLVGTGQSTNLATPGTAQTVFGGGDDCLLAKIQVHAPPAAPVASYTYYNVPCSSWQVAFTNTSSNANTYKWNFGDGLSSMQVSPTHIYAAPGSYNVKLKATNSSTGITVTTTMTIPVATTPLIATISPTGIVSACKSSDITLTCNNSGDELSYQWRLNGANISGATDQIYTNRNDAGDFDVVVTSTAGCNDTSDPTMISRFKRPNAIITPLGNLDICTTGSVDLQATNGGNLNYQWKRNSANISGATNQIYHATQTGGYKVTVTNANGCSRTSHVTTVSSSCKLTFANAGENSFDVFPNPTSASAVISFQLSASSNITIELNDVEGRKLETIFSGNLLEGTHQINFSRKNLSAGIYFLKMISEEGIVTRKLVIE